MRFSSIIFGAVALLTTSVAATSSLPDFTTCTSQVNQCNKDAQSCTSLNVLTVYPLLALDINTLVTDIQAQINIIANIKVALNVTVQAQIYAQVQALLNAQITALLNIIVAAPILILVDVNAKVQLALQALLNVYVNLIAQLQVLLNLEATLLLALWATVQADLNLAISACAIVKLL
ncbi:MAG: hypothetical protein LQ347_005723 [Umbilicaria vellea]|nr:MAG: hypothetical protein LQ347_005723 [Umbilicaria vellea]